MSSLGTLIVSSADIDGVLCREVQSVVRSVGGSLNSGASNSTKDINFPQPQKEDIEDKIAGPIASIPCTRTQYH